MRIKRFVGILLTVHLVAAWLGGCSGGSGDLEQTDTKSQASDSPKLILISPEGQDLGPDDPIDLTFDRTMDLDSLEKVSIRRADGGADEEVPYSVKHKSGNTYTYEANDSWPLGDLDIVVPSGNQGVKDVHDKPLEAQFTTTLSVSSYGGGGGGQVGASASDPSSPGPKLVLASPSGGKRVALNVPVELTFSEPVDETTFAKGVGFVNISKSAYNHTSDPFIAALKPGTTATYTFKPTAGSWDEATYDLVVGTKVKNKAGTKLVKAYLSSFQASSHESGMGAPVAVSVSWTSPTDGYQYHSKDWPVEVSFTEKMDLSSVQAKFKVLKGGSAVQGTIVAIGEKTFDFKPTSILDKDTTYTIRVDKDVKSKAGGTLAADFQATFKTANY